MGKYEATTDRGIVVLDALNRAWRSWWQAIGAGVLVTVGDLGISLLATGDIYSGDFWHSLIKGIITALLTATFAYAARLRIPPPSAPETTTLPAEVAEQVPPIEESDTPAEPAGDKGPFAG